MDKRTKQAIIVFIVGIVVRFVGINISAIHKSIRGYIDRKCECCHKNDKEPGFYLCEECYEKYCAPKSTGKAFSYSGNTDTKIDAEPVSTVKESSYTKDTSYSKTTSSYKKDERDLDFDPIDYDDPDEYADDAWEIDFDDYDDAYDYWEDY